MTTEQAKREIRMGFSQDRRGVLLQAYRCLAADNSPDSPYWRGYLLYHYGEDLGLDADPIPQFEQAVYAFPRDVHAHYHLGCALFDVGRRDEAERQFEVVLGLVDHDDDGSVEMSLLAEEMRALCRFDSADGPTLVQHVVDLWERADSKWNDLPGQEIKVRPWQLYRRAMSAEEIDREMLERLEALIDG